MIYQLNTGNFKDFNKFKENVLEPRSYFIPFASAEELAKTDIRTERYNSSRVAVMDGKWNFKYYENCNDLPTNFNTDEVGMDKVEVPSVWQHTGYEKPFYLNSRYQFPSNPPHIPEDCPVGVYSKKFRLDELDGNYALTFLGVIACLDLFVNGQYVGYSEGAHNSAEFDVKQFLQAGVNEIVAVVHKFCNGSYLEAQDMFRDNGIFRDVLLTKTGSNSIYDFLCETQKNESGTYNLSVTPKFKLTTSCVYRAQLQDKNGEVLASVSNEVDENNVCAVTFPALTVEEWSAELPTLYTLYLSLESESGETLELIRKQIGFKTVEVQKNLFLFNGKKIKLLGVNHHDTDSQTGYVLSVDKMELDVRTMKEFNMNCVRTSHYPPDPTFLDLCDEYGLYVVDEADIETHGCGSKPNLVSNNPAWREHYWDRVYRMYQRDKNHPSITMWSLGNESGGIDCHDYCYDNLKRLSTIPIHYEGASRSRRRHYDVFSQMYWPSYTIKSYIQIKVPLYTKIPYFLCEYCHAMGVGAGALEDYMQLFYNNDNMMGGCIWEFADHAIHNEEGPYRYTYGGDHGEFIHDGNFCVDGLFFPDRSPHSGALNVRSAYRPVRAKHREANIFSFANKQYFASTKGITLNWELRVDGVKYEDGILPLDIPPQERQNIKLPYQPINVGHDNTIVFIYFDALGREMAKEQIQLTTATAQSPASSDVGDSKMIVEPSEKKIDIKFVNGNLLFNKVTGFIESYVVGGKELINQVPLRSHKGFGFELYRAPIDNDMGMRKNWDAMGLNKLSYRVKKCTIKQSDTQVDMLLKFEGTTPVRYLWKDFTSSFSLHYTVLLDGRILVDTTLDYVKGIRNLPRYGMVLEMPKEFNQVCYFGMGDEQSLSDFNAHVALGVYQSRVADMHEKYIRPQESGMRSECRWAEVTNEAGVGLRFDYLDRHFVFNANHYTVQQLAQCGHIEDVKEYDTTNVHIDGFMMGAGSNSCGQKPTKEHLLKNKKLQFSFSVTPIVGTDEKED